MERSHKIIVLLLVLAIIFSVVSIAINLFASNITVPDRVTGQVVGDSGGGVSFVVERNNVEGAG
jgi:hypothetical protein